MKNTITLLVTILIVASGMSSCGAVLIKRQHGPGYYVNKNPGMPTAQSDRSDNKHIKPSSTRAENPTEEEAEFPVSEQIVIESQPDETITQLATNTQPEFASEETSTQTDKSAGVENDEVEPAKPSLYEWSSTTRLAEKMNIADDQSAQANSAAREEGGLSLFGIIILIIVALWLIAALSGGWGLGGLIHILLVVALILLILWLLRII